MTVKPLVIGLAGGTGSGKSTVAEGLLRHAAGQVATLPQDAYYLAQPGIPFAQREACNYDEPHAFDTELLIAQIDALIQGEGVDRPVYDFTVHDRSEATVRIEPHPIVLVEGILVLHDAALRERMALKVFVDAPADERFIRRLERDFAERVLEIYGTASGKDDLDRGFAALGDELDAARQDHARSQKIDQLLFDRDFEV